MGVLQWMTGHHHQWTREDCQWIRGDLPWTREDLQWIREDLPWTRGDLQWVIEDLQWTTEDLPWTTLISTVSLEVQDKGTGKAARVRRRGSTGAAHPRLTSEALLQTEGEGEALQEK